MYLEQCLTFSIYICCYYAGQISALISASWLNLVSLCGGPVLVWAALLMWEDDSMDFTYSENILIKLFKVILKCQWFPVWNCEAVELSICHRVMKIIIIIVLTEQVLYAWHFCKCLIWISSLIMSVSPVYRRVNRGAALLCNLLSITQIVSGRAGIWW